MVNPGHPSRGCQRCRSSKIKCDQGIPACDSCRKKHRQCIYQDNVFRLVEISSTGRVRGRTPAVPLNETVATSTTQPSIHQTSNDAYCELIKHPSPYDDQYFLTILSHVLFPNILGGDCQWPGYVALYQDQRGLAYQSLRALAQACAGQALNQPGLVEQALWSYNSCLRLLNQMLSKPKVEDDEDVLIPIVIFGGFESLFLTTNDGWIRHTLGLAKLFELRGPRSFSPEGIAWQVFRSCRQVMIMAALYANRHTFLSRTEWLELPWVTSQASKNSFERLLDIVAELPGLNVHILEQPIDNRRAGLHQNVRGLLSRLGEWRRLWDMSPDGEEFIFPIPLAGGRGYPREHLGLALGYLSPYSAFCDTLFQGAHIFAVNLALATLPRGMRGASELVLMAECNAYHICRSLPYFMTSQRSKLDVLWSMRLAWKILQGPRTPASIKQWFVGQVEQLAVSFENWMGGTRALGRGTWDTEMSMSQR